MGCSTPAFGARVSTPATGIFRYSPRDSWLVTAALAHAALLAIAWTFALAGGAAVKIAAAVVTAVGIVWTSNTVAHLHLHRPIFRRRSANRVFSHCLGLLVGVPQTLWGARHLAHHTGVSRTPRRARLAAEVGVIAAAWSLMLFKAPHAFLLVHLPGYALGLLLCQWQGTMEHERGDDGGISHYGAFYNFAWFNDGYHAEHHRWPSEHWTRLPARRLPEGHAPESAHPPLTRVVERWRPLALARLERVALRSKLLQDWLVDCHASALRRLLPSLGATPVRRIAVVGGGLFPRTVLVLRRLLPDAELVVWEMNPAHVAIARARLAEEPAPPPVEFVVRRFDRETLRSGNFDLAIVPLAFEGDLDALSRASATPIAVHDWVWRARSRNTTASVVVSPLLLKRLHLLAPHRAAPDTRCRKRGHGETA